MGDMSKPASEDTAVAMLASLSDEQLRAELERREAATDEAAKVAVVAFWGEDGRDHVLPWDEYSKAAKDQWRRVAKAVLYWKERQGR